LPRGSVAFITWTGRRWRRTQPGSLLGNQQGGLIFAPPLPPLGTILAGNQFPLSLSPEAALAFVSPSINPGWRTPQTGKLFRFDGFQSAEARGKKVVINGEVFFKASSPAFAAQVVHQLRQLSKLDRPSRENAIEELFRNQFDTGAIDRRWQEFQKRTAGIQLLANSVFAHLFLVSPIVLQYWSLRRCWPMLVVVLFALTIATAILFRRAHKHFYPEATEDRFSHFLTILLAPATTIRANDVLSRPLLEGFHPLAIARVLGSDQEFREFAGQMVREVSYPALPLWPGDDPVAQAAERQSRTLLLKILEAFLKNNGLDPRNLVQSPARADATSQSYCPRCLAQFTIPEGACADCGGIELARFAPSATETKQSTNNVSVKSPRL
jgi:hypothetical protein